jgi:hypothetical protein
VDNQVDGKRFRDLMDQVHALIRDGFKANDAWADAMWKALRDVSFAEVKTNADRYMASATRDTALPKPSHLRNGPPKILSSGLPTPAQLKAERLSVKHWRELKQTDPIGFEIEWRAARAFTAMAQCEDGSDEYADWLQQYRRWGALRYAPRAEQEEACRNFLGIDPHGVDPP